MGTIVEAGSTPSDGLIRWLAFNSALQGHIGEAIFGNAKPAG